MDTRQQLFLSAVLGEVGATALTKAAERSTALEHALVPRAILSWIQSASLYEGQVPGLAETFVSFEKSGDGFTGSIGVGQGVYRFEHASLFHLAPSIAVSLGVEHEEVPSDLRDIDIEKLGKSIDLLAKVHRASIELKKPAQEDEDEDLEKGKEGPGPAHAPNAPVPPTPPTPVAPQPSKNSKPKSPKPPAAAGKTMKLTRSESTHACGSCGLAQFAGDRFVACLCFRDLVKSVAVVGSDSETITVKLDTRAWDSDGILTFLESVGRQ